jgi:SAM-dependent methyltransferase
VSHRDRYSIRIGGGDTATPLNLRKRAELLERIVGLRERRVLDAGCGAGEFVEEFARRGADSSGVEFNAEKVACYRQRHPDSPRVTQGDIAQIAAPDASFDLILFNEVLEHVPEEEAVLAEAHRLLRPRGILALFGPNRLYPFETHGVLTRRSHRPLSPWIPGVPYLPVRIGRQWLDYPARNYWPWELGRLVRAAGFRIVGRRWLWQTFENISGHQPDWVRKTAPALRWLAERLERCPGARCFGVTQAIFAEKLG